MTVTADPLLPGRVRTVIEALGSKARLAELLEVSRSQPGRWAAGDDVPSETAQRRIQDLEYVLTRAARTFPRDVADVWLTSPNAMLDGAVPLAVLHLEGPAPVVAALDAATAGSYA